MDSIRICGGKPLLGTARIQGSKNAVLPILAATVLVPGISILENCPRITDVFFMIKLLQSIGCTVRWEAGTVIVDASFITDSLLPEEYVTRMRSSVILMGAVLGRKNKVQLSYPGGCVIGERPIDLHLKAFEKMNITFSRQGEELHAVTNQITGNEIRLGFPSVGATENIILAAATAKGTTEIYNAAKEPEVISLCNFLNLAGADITFNKTENRIRIQGVDNLKPCRYRIPADRIVAGTYLLGAMAAGGEIFLEDAPWNQLTGLISVIRQMGGQCRHEKNGIFLKAPSRSRAVPIVRTAVYPGFATDLQSPLMAALCVAKGDSVIEETIFENRFRIVGELRKMNAAVIVDRNRAVIKGRETLQGAPVKAKELRGGAALLIAGLAAEGETIIENRHFIDRGYEDVEKDIRSLGGII